MSNLWNLIKKELKELITISSVASILVIVVVFMMLGSLIGGQVNEQNEAPTFGIINMDEDGIYSDNAMHSLPHWYSETYKASADGHIKSIPCDTWGDNDKIMRAMDDAGINTLVVINKDFSKNIAEWKPGQISIVWKQDNTGVFSSMSTITAIQISGAINSFTTDLFMKNNIQTGDAPLTDEQIKFLKSPTFNGSVCTFLMGTPHDGVTPADIASLMSSQSMFVPIVIMLIIVMIGSILISSMGNEKENKTLETLLTLPVNRTTIVTGKLIGSAIAGLIMGGMYMVGMYFYIDGLSGATKTTTSVTLADLGLILSATDWIIIATFMFLAILCALGMCMIFGAFAKNYKAAQTYIMPITVLAMIPMFVTMFSSYNELPGLIQGVLFAIPFTHPMLVMNNLMFGNMSMVAGGLVYMIIFAIVMIMITVRLYKSDILLTGLAQNTRLAKLFSFGKKPE